MKQITHKLTLAVAGLLTFSLFGFATPIAETHTGYSASSVTTVVVTLHSRKANGKTWDLVWGKPDPYIVVNGQSYRSHRCQNRFSCSFRVRTSNRMVIEVWDADVQHDDFAGSTRCARGYVCQARSAQVKVY